MRKTLKNLAVWIPSWVMFYCIAKPEFNAVWQELVNPILFYAGIELIRWGLKKEE